MAYLGLSYYIDSLQGSTNTKSVKRIDYLPYIFNEIRIYIILWFKNVLARLAEHSKMIIDRLKSRTSTHELRESRSQQELHTLKSLSFPQFR